MSPRIRNQRPTNVAYYWRNRDAELFRVRVRQAGTTEMLREWRSVPCTDCGHRFEPYQMDFDHRDPSNKLFNLMTGRAMLMSDEKLRAEAAKCDVVCANCHRMRTKRQEDARPRKHTFTAPSQVRRMERFRQRSARLAQLQSYPCLDCDGRFPVACMDFDHRDPASKKFTVSRLRLIGTDEEFEDEIAKCDVVCANCHRMRTYRRGRKAA